MSSKWSYGPQVSCQPIDACLLAGLRSCGANTSVFLWWQGLVSLWFVQDSFWASARVDTVPAWTTPSCFKVVYPALDEANVESKFLLYLRNRFAFRISGYNGETVRICAGWHGFSWDFLAGIAEKALWRGFKNGTGTHATYYGIQDKPSPMSSIMGLQFLSVYQSSQKLLERKISNVTFSAVNYDTPLITRRWQSKNQETPYH